ncbi:MAG: hypothetical protein MJE66_06610, partial [Proteobacteria bacterium]|nr:hypothetical protein [Pseudomonadota bacterium]
AGRRERRLEAASAFVRETLERRYGSYGLERIGGPSGLAGRVREAGASSTFRLVRDLSQEIEDALRKPAGPR